MTLWLGDEIVRDLGNLKYHLWEMALRRQVNSLPFIFSSSSPTFAYHSYCNYLLHGFPSPLLLTFYMPTGARDILLYIMV